MSETPSPQVSMKVPSWRYGARRLIRPPVAVSWPVSMRSTVQSSGSEPFPLRETTLPSFRPTVRSEWSDAYSSMYRLITSPL